MQVLLAAALDAMRPMGNSQVLNRLLGVAHDIVWTVRASGGIMRSYKRNKSTFVHLATCVPCSPWAQVRWDGLFFSLWSSMISEATDWLCGVDDPEWGLQRCYWCEKSDPIHTIYLAHPLSADELKYAAQQRPEILVEAIAMSLLPWNIPLQWLLLLEGHLRQRWELDKYLVGVPPVPDDTITEMLDLYPALGDVVPDSGHIGDLPEDAVLFVALRGALTDEQLANVMGTYGDRSFNRLGSVQFAAEPTVGQRCGKALVTITPDSVEPTYHYLRPDAEDNSRAIGGVLANPEFIDLSERAATASICGLPRASAEDEERINLASSAQASYYRMVLDNAPEIATRAADKAVAIARIVEQNKMWIASRVDNILGFIHGIAELTVEMPLEVTVEVHDDRKLTVVGLPLVKGFIDRVGEKGAQKGMPIHMYHMLQTSELAELEIAGKRNRILHGGDGGLAIV